MPATPSARPVVGPARARQRSGMTQGFPTAAPSCLPATLPARTPSPVWPFRASEAPADAGRTSAPSRPRLWPPSAPSARFRRSVASGPGRRRPRRAHLQAVALDQVHVERGTVGQDLAAAAHRAQDVGPHGPGQLAHRRLDELPGRRRRTRRLLPRCRGSRPAAPQPPGGIPRAGGGSGSPRGGRDGRGAQGQSRGPRRRRRRRRHRHSRLRGRHGSRTSARTARTPRLPPQRLPEGGGASRLISIRRARAAAASRAVSGERVCQEPPPDEAGGLQNFTGVPGDR